MPLDSIVGPLAAFLAPTSPMAPPPVQFHGEGVVHTTLYAGVRSLKDDFAPADEPLLFGIGIDVHEPGRNASFEAGYFYSTDEESTRVAGNSIDVSSTIHELWAGGRWSFDPWSGPVQPYVGLGGSLLRAKYEAKGLGNTNENTGWAIGLYAHGGVDIGLGGGWSVGLDLRGLVSTSAKLQEEVPLDYVQAAATLSWAW